MGHTQPAEDETGNVLLSYRLPSRKVAGFHMMQALSIPLMILGALCVRQPSATLGTAAAILSFLCAFVLMLRWAEVRTLAAAFSCTNSSMEITTFSHRKMLIAWGDINWLRCTRGLLRRYVLLVYNDHSVVDLSYMPVEILHQFANILRETSNARVLGPCFHK